MPEGRPWVVAALRSDIGLPYDQLLLNDSLSRSARGAIVGVGTAWRRSDDAPGSGRPGCPFSGPGAVIRRLLIDFQMSTPRFAVVAEFRYLSSRYLYFSFCFCIWQRSAWSFVVEVRDTVM